MKKIILILLVLFLTTGQEYAAVNDPSPGNVLFQQNCVSCHALQTRVVGPALHNVSDRHSEEWIIKFVHSSQTLIKSGDAAAVNLFTQFNQTIMPDHQNLSDQDIKNIITYIKSESAVSQLPAAVATEQLPQTIASDDNDLYKGKPEIIRQLIYVYLPGQHLPILPSDYHTWFVIGGLISLSLALLFILVKAKTLITNLKKKFG